MISILFWVLWTLGGLWLALRYPIARFRALGPIAVLVFVLACGPVLWALMLAIAVNDMRGGR